jgi:hypothetical protein
MQAPNRITLVLRAREGETLESLCQYAQLGAPVAIGRAGAVIASAHEGDRDEVAHQLEHQLTLAEAAIKRGVRPGCGLRIDDWIATVQNARRYEWLRNAALISGHANVPMVRFGLGDPLRTEALDNAVDAFMALTQSTESQVDQVQP